ncbi:3-deoxy-D-manno-octulosonic acid kinase [Marinobacter zhejiangensis]|uniref:3-deoxy-D-manno-octulosonic acid kinase n=1 Tax=Marinobacter zhejiangensis TaxID=488535 RepID=A0A1I4SD07_9GAMM|nr:3-deoxy-D-manno-octulosonic acid kinase [Marinobacter zhejiangensis]SFM62357.1 3-deoxy-D-manno-octulosonic acid kinase [Marinobacter zhejiangensis]
MAEVVTVSDNGGHFLVCSRYREQFQPDWFSPEHWGEASTPVSSGGRGSAWFIDAGDQHWVLRQYLRGGLIAKLLSNHYLYTGSRRIRCVRELELLEQLHREGLPVPEPVAAAWSTRRGAFYTCAILMKRLSDTVPMGAVLESLPLSRWRQVGAVIRRFHDHHVYHADLNCFNVLLSDSDVYLIDFDKGQLRSGSEDGAPWKQANLERLKRSIVKALGSDSPLLADRWNSLLDGYRQSGSPA